MLLLKNLNHSTYLYIFQPIHIEARVSASSIMQIEFYFWQLQLSIVPQQNGDRCHCFWSTYSIDVRKYPTSNLFSPFPFSFPLLCNQQNRQAKSCDIQPHFPRALNTATWQLRLNNCTGLHGMDAKFKQGGHKIDPSFYCYFSVIF